MTRDRLREIFGPDFRIEVTKVLKNNSVKLSGIAILHKECNVTPTIYLEDYYTDYCDGMDIEEIVNGILRTYNRNRNVEGVDLDILKTFQRAKDNIVFKIINYDKNLELLSEAPHRRFLDLAVVYTVLLKTDSDVNASVTIKNEHMKSWGVCEDDLYQVSKVNSPRIAGPEILSLFEMVGQITGVSPDPGLEEDNRMYVLTNKRRLNGASCILYDNVLSEFSRDLGKDLFIIPSSIHEVILFPADAGADTDRLTEIINEVNCTQVSKQEVLSGRLYRYSRNEDRICCV